MSEYANLQLEKRGHTAVVTFANPPANTWTREALIALPRLIADLEADRNIYTLVLTGAGDKFFSAGAELSLFKDGGTAVVADMIRHFGAAFEAVAGFRGVTIAAINGYAMGGGLEVALACDVRIAEEQARMALPECRVGLIPAAGGTQRLAWLIGEGWAKRMIFFAEQVDAATAERIGLIQERVAQGEALARALERAEQVAGQSPLAVAAAKRLVDGARQRPVASNLPLEREAFVELAETEDLREGVNAFLDKREPQWRNR